jgi:diguanylate cyclase (GGDEF)-like protein
VQCRISPQLLICIKYNFCAKIYLYQAKQNHLGRGLVLSQFEDQVFSFDDGALTAQTPQSRSIDTKRALAAAGESAYHWSIATDALVWSENAQTILGCPAIEIASGKRFAALLDIDNLTSRYETVMRNQQSDQGEGVAFKIEYCFKSEGRNSDKSIWVEDHGRWFAGADGKPSEVYGTVRRIDDRFNRDQHLNFIGNCDPLTGMMNRGRMTEALGEAITVAKQENTPCAFAIAAINNLSVVNDSYGFEVADEVIVALGQRLRHVLRAGDGIARYSGGKFGVILNNCSETELQVALERFLCVARDSVIETGHGPVWSMLSIGAICLPSGVQTAQSATARAEEALNEARKQASDAFVIFKPSERRSEERKLNARCATEIVHCLKTDRFKLAYQPIISAKTGIIAKHEALLRMSDGDDGELIAAGHLIPVSERLGLVRLIDRAVVQMTINALHSYPDAHLAMNVSATTATDPRWYSQLLEMISGNAEITPRLTVEITETVALSDISATRQFVEKLRSAGCAVAIDDFGAGYTSFKNLRDLPVNMIKLDGQFCQNIKGRNDNEYIIRSLIDLAGKFNLQTVAEWVENEEDADVLTSWGIDYLQGNYFGAASIIAPWQLNVPSNFVITPPHSVVMSELQHQEFAELTIAVEIPVAVPANVPEPVVEESVAVDELIFTDIEDSISSLKATLDSLRAFAPRAEEQTEIAA